MLHNYNSFQHVTKLSDLKFHLSIKYKETFQLYVYFTNSTVISITVYGHSVNTVIYTMLENLNYPFDQLPELQRLDTVGTGLLNSIILVVKSQE